MRSLWSFWPILSRRVRSNSRRLLILDFDGTLADIVKTPDRAVLKPGTKEALLCLQKTGVYQLIVISGRSVKSLKRLVPVPGIILAGNHGLEFGASKFKVPAPALKAKKLRALIWLIGEKLERRLAGVPGAWVEDKRYTLSVHYRNVPKKDVALFKSIVAAFKKKYSGWPVLWRSGKKIWEVRPRVQWGKGEAAVYFGRKFYPALPIIIGDDKTDEDMFRSFRRRDAITIRVGRSSKSAADYYLSSPKDVLKFLRELCRL